MSDKYTPGPWEFAALPATALHVACVCSGDFVLADVLGIAEGAANARLIAAAPELLEALRTAEAALADIGDSEGEPLPTFEWCEARAFRILATVRAAIARATGAP